MTPRPVTELLAGPMPSDAEAEEILIGAVLLDGRMMDEVAETVDASDFFVDAFARMWKHLRRMHDQDLHIDDQTLLASLRESQEIERVGGVLAIHNAGEKCPTPLSAPTMAKRLRRLSDTRRLICAGIDLIQECYDPGCDPQAARAKAEAAMDAAVDRQEAIAVKDASQVAEEAKAWVADCLAGDKGGGLSTSLETVDLETSLLKAGRMIVLGARTSAGKTQLAGQMAEFTARRESVLYVSLEVKAAEVGVRLACSRAGVSRTRLDMGQLYDGEHERINAAADELKASKLFFVDKGGTTIQDIRRQCKRIQRTHGLSLLVLDYLQLVTPADRRLIREQQVAEMSRAIKQMAGDFGIPVLVLAQLNREAEKERPKLSHLRESGSLEQDADVVLFIHRDWDAGTADLIIAKNRMTGKTATYKMQWNAQREIYETPPPGQLCTNAADFFDGEEF